ncbi:hypothetical protein PIB30_093433 [Stylosanthes scabra]|uniref:Uncharacterized protein n=1 Tax=Stylosanthes scabra TaxID=79078 RepID=A0ABU6WTH2_9FABA|nr:hypothetical protein [Stylosanthes scabra]
MINQQELKEFFKSKLIWKKEEEESRTSKILEPAEGLKLWKKKNFLTNKKLLTMASPLIWRRWMNGGGDHSKRRRRSRKRQKAAEDLKLFTKKKNLLKNKKLLTMASPLMWRRCMNGGGDYSKRRPRSGKQRQSAKRRALMEVQRWMIKPSIASSMHEGGTKLDDQSLILIFDPDLVNDVTIKLLAGHWFPKLWYQELHLHSCNAKIVEASQASVARTIVVTSVSMAVMLFSAAQPESSRLGFFLLNEESLLQVLIQI